MRGVGWLSMVQQINRFYANILWMIKIGRNKLQYLGLNLSLLHLKIKTVVKRIWCKLFAGMQQCCSLKSSNILKHQTRNLDNASFHECAIKESIKPLANKKLPCTSWRIKLDHYCHTFNATSKQKYVTIKGHERISCRLFFVHGWWLLIRVCWIYLPSD